MISSMSRTAYTLEELLGIRRSSRYRNRSELRAATTGSPENQGSLKMASLKKGAGKEKVKNEAEADNVKDEEQAKKGKEKKDFIKKSWADIMDEEDPVPIPKQPRLLPMMRRSMNKMSTNAREVQLSTIPEESTTPAHLSFEDPGSQQHISITTLLSTSIPDTSPRPAHKSRHFPPNPANTSPDTAAEKQKGRYRGAPIGYSMLNIQHWDWRGKYIVETVGEDQIFGRRALWVVCKESDGCGVCSGRDKGEIGECTDVEMKCDRFLDIVAAFRPIDGELAAPIEEIVGGGKVLILDLERKDSVRNDQVRRRLLSLPLSATPPELQPSLQKLLQMKWEYYGGRKEREEMRVLEAKELRREMRRMREVERKRRVAVPKVDGL